MPLIPDPATADGSQSAALRVFNLYQLVVSFLLVTLQAVLGVHGLGGLHADLFRWTIAVHVLLATACLFFCPRLRADPKLTAGLLVGLGLTEILLLMHASGGITSGVGVLTIPCIAAAGLMLSGRLALLWAAAGALVLLADQIHAQLRDLYDTTAYTQTGLLGAALFATALAANALSRRSLTHQVLAEHRGRELAELGALNEHIIGNMSAGVVVIDTAERIRLMNQEAARLLDQDARAQGEPVLKISPPLHRGFRRWLHQPEMQTARRLTLASGRTIEMRCSSIGDEAHPLTLLELHDTEDLDRRIQASKLSSLGRLSASIAHEIRNPLAAISHAAQLLAESDTLDAADRRLVQIIHDQAKRMNGVIANVLGIYRREPPAPELIPLGPWLRSYLEELRRQQGMTADAVQLDVPEGELGVRADPGHLRQVLDNLIGNALQHGGKAGEAPRILVRVQTLPDAEGLRVEVVDHGSGIPARLLSRLFEPKYGTSGGGHGLGLYIAHELCEANGARLSYAPAEGGGSRFRIDFSGVPGT